eukprot:Pompholyxophrys_punicea_v1_NODE_1493_length_686_cov_1.470681.p2 type:complete len:130 gc:universal NODE_1493_length_686_cov_1.470681:158-547(+)
MRSFNDPRIASLASLASLDRGFKFFRDWASENGTHATNFLHWITWDELRLTYYGFKGFVQKFFRQHGDYFISPIRINGSSVETLFGQLKNLKGSSAKLCAAEYGYRLAMLETKVSVVGPHTRDSYPLQN